MWIYITCSRCGVHRRISDRKPEHAKKLAGKGWWNYGTALYCPSCSASWHERNIKELGTEADAENRILMVMRCCQRKEK